MKKKKFSLKKAFLIVLFAALVAGAGVMYKKLSELTNQLTYLQDSTSVILSDMSNLQSNIEKTLQEENSAIEDYTITVASLDFANKTYKVDVSVVPKEYTDKTQISIYFGTRECQLKRGEYAFTGTQELPIDKNFDSNITFLISNSRKKTTEVLNDYQGLDLNLDQVLMASLDDAPMYRNGNIRLDSTCNVELEGNGLFEFQSLDLVTMLDEKEIDSTDLLAQMNGTDEDGNVFTGDAADGTESADSDAKATGTISGVSGSSAVSFVYALPEPDTEDSQAQDSETTEKTPEKQHICILVRAKTTNGYWFEYTVFEGDYLTADTKMDKDNFQWNTKNAAYDRSGNELELDVNEIQKND